MCLRKCNSDSQKASESKVSTVLFGFTCFSFQYFKLHILIFYYIVTGLGCWLNNVIKSSGWITWLTSQSCCSYSLFSILWPWESLTSAPVIFFVRRKGTRFFRSMGMKWEHDHICHGREGSKVVWCWFYLSTRNCSVWGVRCTPKVEEPGN